MYLDRAEEEDKKAAERWKGDADGILVFVRPRGKKPCHVDHSLQLTIPYYASYSNRLACSPPQ
jgi:hypothetical protein